MSNYKEVYFGDYCNKCKHCDLEGTEEPCNECLAIPMRLNSHKPENFKESDTNAKR